MSNDRRRRRRERQNASYQPAGPIEFPGMMGWMQRNQRSFYLGGILVMVLSLGGIFFATQFGGGQSGTSASGSTTSTSDTASTTQDVAATPATDGTAAPDDDASAEPEDGAIVRSYAAPPELTIDPSAAYEAVIRTERGEIRLELLAEEAPGYVNNFVFLARNRFYEGLTFHRVVPGFVAQAGDPTATGFGGSGYRLPEERNALSFDTGVISMAKAGSIVDGSQFFITLAPTPGLAADFTVFGRVTAGMDVLQALTPRDPGQTTAAGDLILEIEIIEG
ncbi:MAG: peptidylprolyl isomerase [Chloroflexi bacterium]|nr:peptidylprolyl isomerase [Chloroflexota bacterium]